jgi:Ca-activated chloride channel family protein
VALSVITHNAALPQVASLGGGARQSGYFLVVASPTVTDAAKAALPRRVVIVFDRSGSMQGKKIEQAKNALRFALGRLRPHDTFNIVTFSDATERFAPLPVAATSDNRKRAEAFVDDIIADGGTNIDAALREGIAQFPERGSGNTLLFMTDGLPTVGNTNKDAIVKNALRENGRKARAFVFGVGYDVDVPFLDQVAQALRGDADYVRPDEDIEVKVSRYVAKTSAPVLENLKLTVSGDGVNVGEIYPKPADLPDLFAGSQLVLVGRYTGGGSAAGNGAPARITLTGEASGKPQTYTLSARFPALDTSSEFLPRLWATRKIGYLMDDLRLRESAEAKQEIIQQIIALSREYGVLTPFTALFVPEPGRELAAADALNAPLASANGSVLGRSGGAMPGGFGGGGFGGAAGGVAAAPAARTGESAVNASQDARAKRVQGQVGNRYTYAAKAGGERARDEALARRIQNVAGRTFYQVGSVWTDATYDAKKQNEIVKVKLYSPAYFALVRRNGDLARWAALGRRCSFGSAPRRPCSSAMRARKR